jgi:hypothetical protein
MIGGQKRKNEMQLDFSKRWIGALPVTVCILAQLACQFTQSVPQPGGVTATPVAPGRPTAGASIAAPTGPSTEAPPVDVVFGPGSFSLMDPTVGLADLSSYKATLNLSFNGTQAGKPSQWSHTYTMLASQEPAVHQITVEAAGGDPSPVFMAEENGMNYEKRGAEACTASPIGSGSPLAAEWEPAGFISALIGAEAAGSETVNSVAVDQYAFDERALGETGFTKSTGQVWVASDKGYIVRYLLTTTAGSEYFGEGIDGTLTWEYNLTDINQPVLIELPAWCTSGLVDAPLMPSAQNINRTPGLTVYSTADSISDVLAFYQDQLPALGWEVTGEPSVVDTMGWVSFIHGDQQLTVMVTSGDNGNEVRLLIDPAPAPDANP